DRVELSTDGTSWVRATGTTSWTVALTLEEEETTIYARAADRSGNTAMVSITVTVETEPVIPPPGLEVSTTVIIVLGLVIGAALSTAVALLLRRIRGFR
ncbi:MAG: hypothetical protein ACE5LS_06410, partial [Thermoplasmata archaeon]